MQFMRMGYPRERILQAFSEIADPSKRNISSLWPSVLCRLREDEVYGCHSKSQSAREDFHTTSTTLETTTKSSVDYQKNGKRSFHMFICSYVKPMCSLPNRLKHPV